MKKEKELNDEVRAEPAENKQGAIELEERAMMIWLPSKTIEAEVVARVWHNGEVINVSKGLDMDEVREGFKEAEQYYYSDDTTFVLTDKGRKELEGYASE